MLVQCSLALSQMLWPKKSAQKKTTVHRLKSFFPSEPDRSIATATNQPEKNCSASDFFLLVHRPLQKQAKASPRGNLLSLPRTSADLARKKLQKTWQVPRRNSILEEKTGYISTLKRLIKCKITVDKFRSCTSHKQ